MGLTQPVISGVSQASPNTLHPVPRNRLMFHTCVSEPPTTDS